MQSESPDCDRRALVDSKFTCGYLGISNPTLWRGVKSGRIPAPVRFGGIVRWRLAELEAFVAQLGTK